MEDESNSLGKNLQNGLNNNKNNNFLYYLFSLFILLFESIYKTEFNKNNCIKIIIDFIKKIINLFLNNNDKEEKCKYCEYINNLKNSNNKEENEKIDIDIIKKTECNLENNIFKCNNFLTEYFRYKFLLHPEIKNILKIILVISFCTGLTGIFYPFILLNIIGIFIFCFFIHKKGDFSLNVEYIKKFYIFLLGFYVFYFLNWLWISKYYEHILKKDYYNNTFQLYQDSCGYDLSGSDFFNYLMNYNNNENGPRFKLFKEIKDKIFGSDNKSLKNFIKIYSDDPSNEYDNSGKYKIAGVTSDHITSNLKTKKTIDLYTDISKFGITDSDNNNENYKLSFKINENEIIKDIPKNSNFDISELLYHYKIAIYIENYCLKLEENKKQFIKNISEKSFLRHITFYPYQAFYYTLTTASTIGYGDFYPVGALPKMNFILFAMFIVIFLTYEIVY
jgi:hypothetical protein